MTESHGLRGVDSRARGVGSGRALVRHVLALAVGQRDGLGCVGVVTDAKPDAVDLYRKLEIVPLAGVVEGVLTSEPTAMFLGIDTIAAAAT